MSGSPLPRQTLERRLRAQLLTGPKPASAPPVVRHMLAVQSQDPRGARLAIRVRTEPGSTTATDVDAALERGELIVSWLNRGTLHLLAAEDYGLLHMLTTPQLATANNRRLSQEGVDDAMARRGVGVVRKSLAADGPLTAPELGERLRGAGVRTEGQALVHVLFAATLAGVCVRGPMRGARQAFVLTEDWLEGDARRLPDGDVALAELARRFLVARGPAGDRDLAWWAGITLGVARRALGLITGELESGSGGVAHAGPVRLAGSPRAAGVPAPRLLGSFEEILMSWRERELFAGEHGGKVMSGGIFRPIALVGGRAVGTWRLERGRIGVEPFGEIGADDELALERDGEDVVRFLGV